MPVAVRFMKVKIWRGNASERVSERAGLVSRDKSKHFNVSLLMPHFNGKEREKHREICVSKLNWTSRTVRCCCLPMGVQKHWRQLKFLESLPKRERASEVAKEKEKQFQTFFVCVMEKWTRVTRKIAKESARKAECEWVKYWNHFCDYFVCKTCKKVLLTETNGWLYRMADIYIYWSDIEVKAEFDTSRKKAEKEQNEEEEDGEKKRRSNNSSSETICKLLSHK